MTRRIPTLKRSGRSWPTNEKTLTKFDSDSVRRGLLCSLPPRFVEAATTLTRHRTRSGASLSGELFQIRGPDPVCSPRTVSKTRLSYPRSVMGKGSRREAVWVGARWPVPPTEKKVQTSVDVGQSVIGYCFRYRVPNDEDRIRPACFKRLTRSTSCLSSALLLLFLLLPLCSTGCFVTDSLKYDWQDLVTLDPAFYFFLACMAFLILLVIILGVLEKRS